MNNIFQTDQLFARYSLKEGVSNNSRNQGDFDSFFYGRFIHSDEFWTGYSGNTDIAAGSYSFEKVIFMNGFLYFAYGILVYLFFFLRYKISLYHFFISFGFWLALNYQRPSFNILFFYLFFTTVMQSDFYNAKQIKENIVSTD